MLKIEEIKKLKRTEIESLLGELSLELAKARIQKGVDRATVKSHRFRQIKKQIARLLTVRNQKIGVL